jgi:hypothetical protein
MVRMSILIAYLESSRKIEFNGYDIIGMRALSIFCSVYFYTLDTWQWSPSHPGQF